MTEEQAARILEDFHRLRDRMVERQLMFYHELMGSLCLTMMYDISSRPMPSVMSQIPILTAQPTS